MSQARTEFYNSMRGIVTLVTQSLLTDVFPLNDKHNINSSILRRGLAVSAFSLLEAYLQTRLEELTVDLVESKINYNDFGAKLQRFLTVDAVIGIANRLNFARMIDQKQIAEGLLTRIMGYVATPPTYTAIGFSPKGSNVSKDDIKAAIAAFGGSDGWSKLSEIAQDLGSSRVSLQDDYGNIAKLRHQAAHNSSINVPTGDLQTHLEVVTVIGMVFDILCTTLISIHVKEINPARLQSSLELCSHTYRFIDEQINGKWYERSNTQGRVVKIHNNEISARDHAICRKQKGFIVIRNTSQVPIELV